MNISQNWLVRISLGLFIGWASSFICHGPVFYYQANALDYGDTFYNAVFILITSTGMVISAIFLRRWQAAKKALLISVALSFLSVLAISFLPILLILPTRLILALLSGFFVSAWSYFFYYNTPAHKRGQAIADILVIGSIVFTFSSFLTLTANNFLSFIYAIILLAVVFTLCSKMTLQAEQIILVQDNFDHKKIAQCAIHSQFKYAFTLLLICIFVISFTMGVTFQVVIPYFSTTTSLVRLYPSLPYMAALIVFRLILKDSYKSFIVYISTSVLILSYILFAFSPASAKMMLLVITPMMIAYSIFNYFWWDILCDLCPFSPTPSFAIGISHAVNFFGIFIGSTLSLYFLTHYHLQPSDVAFATIGLTSIIISLSPFLNQYMRNSFSNHIFFIQPPISKNTSSDETDAVPISHLLTARESELVALVLNGYTYRAIAEKLVISENTVKTHAKNIYKKLNINSKYELIQYYTKNSTRK